MRVETESGSIYKLDRIRMTWEREQKPNYQSKHPLRTTGGTLDVWPTVVIGLPLNLFGPPITVGMTGRLVQTSPITKILEE